MTKDRLKEEIGLFKLLLTIAMAMFTSIVSWVWNNAHNAIFQDSAKIITLFFIAFILFYGIMFLFFKIILSIKLLDKYE
jgi:hypothetical protein